MTFTRRSAVVAAMIVGAALGPLVILRDALLSSETDWSGTWWMTAGLTAAVVAAVLGAGLALATTALVRRGLSRA